MTTFIKAKLKEFDYQTNIDKYYRISYCLKINLPKNHHFKIHDDKAIIYTPIYICIYLNFTEASLNKRKMLNVGCKRFLDDGSYFFLRSFTFVLGWFKAMVLSSWILLSYSFFYNMTSRMLGNVLAHNS